MNFQVPQFIETEDKIVGPLTIKQFLYVAAAGALSFILFFLLELWLWVLVTLILIAISLSLAFIKINGRSLITVAFSAFNYYWKPRFYLWKTDGEAQAVQREENQKRLELLNQTKSKLDSLWNQLKTNKQPVAEREITIEPSLTDRTRNSKERFEMMRKINGEQEAERRIDYR
ncbi:MAG: PrgI family protein [bacterium]|nr:PrgI family protein [bacterium]